LIGGNVDSCSYDFESDSDKDLLCGDMHSCFENDCDKNLMWTGCCRHDSENDTDSLT
jgi:hypothetical protein